ncbi:MAG TPA: GNAT family N-acetyltransferase [Bacillota bacterium]|jgi:ribosomal protein S18 acetylase RimI-like enzyme
MNIRRMLPLDLDFAAERTAEEGWTNHGREEFKAGLEYAPEASFVAEEDGRRIGLCVGTPYGEAGFVGGLIVVRAARGRGIGRRLLETTVDHLRSGGCASVYLDGVPAAVPMYERVGFRKICKSVRFRGSAARPEGDGADAGKRADTGDGAERKLWAVRPMAAADLAAVCALDRESFGADRRFFLERRFRQSPELAFVAEAVNEGRAGSSARGVAGFILGRRGARAVSAGPWVVGPGVERPLDLLAAQAEAAAPAGELPIAVGVLDSNPRAVEAVGRFGLEEHGFSWRMVLGPSERLGQSPTAYAIGSPAKG